MNKDLYSANWFVTEVVSTPMVFNSLPLFGILSMIIAMANSRQMNASARYTIPCLLSFSMMDLFIFCLCQGVADRWRISFPLECLTKFGNLVLFFNLRREFLERLAKICKGCDFSGHIIGFWGYLIFGILQVVPK